MLIHGACLLMPATRAAGSLKKGQPTITSRKTAIVIPRRKQDAIWLPHIARLSVPVNKLIDGIVLLYKGRVDVASSLCRVNDTTDLWQLRVDRVGRPEIRWHQIG